MGSEKILCQFGVQGNLSGSASFFRYQHKLTGSVYISSFHPCILIGINLGKDGADAGACSNSVNSYTINHQTVFILILGYVNANIGLVQIAV